MMRLRSDSSSLSTRAALSCDSSPAPTLSESTLVAKAGWINPTAKNPNSAGLHAPIILLFILISRSPVVGALVIENHTGQLGLSHRFNTCGDLAFGNASRWHHQQNVVAQFCQNSRIGAFDKRGSVDNDVAIAVTFAQLADEALHPRRSKKLGARLSPGTGRKPAHAPYTGRINHILQLERDVFEIIDQTKIGFHGQDAVQRRIVDIAVDNDGGLAF